MDDNNLVYDGAYVETEEQKKSLRSFFSTRVGIETLKRFYKLKIFSMIFVSVVIIFACGVLGIISPMLSNLTGNSLSFQELDRILDTLIYYGIIGSAVIFVIAIIYTIIYFSTLKRMSFANPILAEAYKHYKRALFFNILSGVVGAAGESSHSTGGKVFGDLASTGLDIASTYEGYKAQFNVIYGIIYELSKENSNSPAIAKGLDYIRRYKGLIILGIAVGFILGILTVIFSLSSNTFEFGSGAFICCLLLTLFLIIYSVYIDLMYVKFLKLSIYESEQSYQNRINFGDNL